MSLIDMANDLEYLSKDELISQANNPDGRYPVYLVLSEIKRRTDAEQAYMASMPAAQTTVAEERVKEFSGAASESPMFTQTMPQGMDFSPNAAPPMTPPMQTMAAGGQVKGMATGQGTYLDQYNQYLQAKALFDAMEAERTKPVPGLFDRVSDFASNRYGGGLGGVGNLLLDASLAIPGLGLAGLGARAGFQAASRLAPRIAPKTTARVKDYFRNPFTKPDVDTARKATAEKIIKSRQGMPSNPSLARREMIPMGGTNLPAVAGRKFSPVRALGTTAGASLLAQSLMPDGKKPLEAEDFGDFVYTPTETKDSKAAIDPNDLIKLGGLLMSSGTPKELGTGLIGYADQKALEQATASEAEMAALYDLARARKAEAETDYMPIESLTNQLDVINDAYKAAYENGDADEMRRLGSLRNQLINQLSGIQGFALQSANEYDKFATAT